jgi:hypothetical protein
MLSLRQQSTWVLLLLFQDWAIRSGRRSLHKIGGMVSLLVGFMLGAYVSRSGWKAGRVPGVRRVAAVSS